MWTPDPSIIITAEQRAAEKRRNVEKAINAERARRIEAGTVIDGVYVTGRDEDARNLMSLAMIAQLPNAPNVTFRDGDNVDHELTPEQVISLWTQSAEYVSHLYARSWAIKEMDPLPDDITENELWN